MLVYSSDRACPCHARAPFGSLGDVDNVCPVMSARPCHAKMSILRREMQPTFFATQSAFHLWLEEHHDTTQEVLVGFYKKSSGNPSITWPEAVDEALCFGWIDGVRKGIDAVSYTIRFTPRKSRSSWSAVNVKRARELAQLGHMREEGRDQAQATCHAHRRLRAWTDHSAAETPDRARVIFGAYGTPLLLACCWLPRVNC